MKKSAPRRKLPPGKRRLEIKVAPFGEALSSALEKATAELASMNATAAKHPLARIFEEAVTQATRGKGNARHGMGRDSAIAENFFAQDWLAIAQRHGPGFLSGQAEKKLRESLAMPPAEARSERLGVLVYVAMLILAAERVRA